MNKFRLQPVLDYRQILEDRAQQDLAEALEKEGTLLTTLVQEEQALKTLYTDFGERQKAGITPQEFSLYQNHISHKVAALAGLVEEWEAARETVEAQRQALCAASRDKQLLEKLKEKKEREQKHQLRLKETAFLDEIAVQHFKR